MCYGLDTRDCTYYRTVRLYIKVVGRKFKPLTLKEGHDHLKQSPLSPYSRGLTLDYSALVLQCETSTDDGFRIRID